MRCWPWNDGLLSGRGTGLLAVYLSRLLLSPSLLLSQRRPSGASDELNCYQRNADVGCPRCLQALKVMLAINAPIISYEQVHLKRAPGRDLSI